MVSALLKERFAALLLELAECERKTELTRQVLVDRSEFDAYSAFRRISTGHYGGITLFELKEFFQHHDISVESYELDLLFVHLDFDGDGVITWAEFLNLVMSKEYHSGCEYGKLADFDLKLEHSLMRFFDQELQNEICLEQMRRVLWDTPGLSEEFLFGLLDVDKNNTLTQEDIHQFLKPYADESYNVSMAERVFRRMDENQDGDVVYDEFLRSMRPIYCYKNHANAVPNQKEMSPTKIYNRPNFMDNRSDNARSKVGGTNRLSRSNLRQSTGSETVRKVVSELDYDVMTGRPSGKRLQVVRATSGTPTRERINAEGVGLNTKDVGLNPEHPINHPNATAHRWDRVMGFADGNVDPMMAMHMGMHPLDVATGATQSRYHDGQYFNPLGAETKAKVAKSPLNPENEDSPLRARVSMPTAEEMYATKVGGAKGKNALDHPYFTHQRLIERTLGDKNHFSNPNMTDAERIEVTRNVATHGLAAWQHGDPSMFATVSGGGWGMPWANPKLSKEEREKMMKEHGVGDWAELSEEEREKMMKEGKMPGGMGGMGPWGGMGGPWGGHGAWGGMGGHMGGYGPWGNPNMTKEEREKMQKEGKWPGHGAWGGMGGPMGGMGPWGGMGGPMGGMGPWGGMGGPGPWGNPNMTKEEREKMQKEGKWPGLGAWGGMGGPMGGMGPWGGMGGPMGGMGPWGNPNMSKEEREKMQKEGK